jgi:uncharacterized membrane protein YhaH (DUF805 family)
MSMTEAVRSVLRHPFTFQGRARRAEYWYWTLTMGLVYAVYLGALGLSQSGEGGVADAAGVVALAAIVLFLLLLLPTFAVLVRRLHDTGRSGWWYWVGAVPVVGGVWLLVLLCGDSGPDNHHGRNPKRALRPIEVDGVGYGAAGRPDYGNIPAYGAVSDGDDRPGRW